MHLKYEILSLTSSVTPGKGALTFFEAEKDISFPIKRIYYIYGTPNNIQRGGHAHKKLQQLLFCPYGSIEISLDDGHERKSILLDIPNKGLVLGNGVWHDMIWRHESSVLCVVASDYYDESDYIRDYQAFLLHVGVGVI